MKKIILSIYSSI